MKLPFYFPLALIIVLIASCSSPYKKLLDAQQDYDNENYCESAKTNDKAYNSLSRKGAKAKETKGRFAFQTAESFRLTERHQEAADWYERCVNLEYFNIEPKIYYLQAEMFRLMGEIPRAKAGYLKYKKLVPEDNLADIGIASCDAIEEYKANVTRHLVKNEDAINDLVMDMAPQFSDKKDSKMVFGSSREGSSDGGKDPRTCENYMDLWEAGINKNGTWTQPTLISGVKINTDANEGTACFDARGKIMFFTRCPHQNKMDLGCDIYMSEGNGKNWEEPTKLELKPEGGDSISVGHPCVSEDGKYLIFSSDLPGGFGGKDLWYTKYEKKTGWAKPTNMGPEINTAGNEMFPTFMRNGDLVFATDGRLGMGGLDMYRSTKVEGAYTWENPTNLGSPLNSVNNDYHLIEKDDKTGFFTSERKGVKGGNNKPDIYSYVLPPYIYELQVNVSEIGNKGVMIPGVNVKVTGSDKSVFEGVTTEGGSIAWDKKPNGDRFVNEDVSYTINISKEGFHEDKKGALITTIGLKDNQNFNIDMGLFPKRPIRLPEVRYPLNSAVLLVDSSINSKDSLNFVYDLLNEYPGMVLELSSHTDSRGSDAKNMTLSIARAKSCVDYLVNEKGIDPKRLVAKGKGETSPITIKDPYNNGADQKMLEPFINSFKKSDPVRFNFYHQRNRRTEGAIITMDYVAGQAVPEGTGKPITEAPDPNK